MTLSKRPKPMDFGGEEEDPYEAEGAADALQAGFRTLDPANLGHTLPIRRARSQAAHPDLQTEVREVAGVFDEDPPSGWPVWLIAFAVAALWALAPIAYAIGYRNNVAPLQNEPFALAVFALLSIGPAALVLGVAYMIRQAQKLSFEGRRAQAMAEEMLAPVVLAAARAGDVTQAVREEIARAGAAADEARETLTALRDALAFETDKLTGATAQSVRTAHELAGTLGRERSEMSSLAQMLDAQAAKVTDAIAQQARMVTEATGVAETQIREAEGALAARAADLAAAAGEAAGAARTAGEDLTRHIARLETAGSGVADQVRAVESGLSEQRTALVALSQALKGDHEAFAVQAELHAQSLREFIETARVSADEMSERAISGGEALRRLMSDAALQFRDLAETAKAEREEFGQSTLHALEAVSAAAADQRARLEAQTRAAVDALAAAAEDTRAAAARHAATAREQVDQLSEAAFNAGQKANQVFEARLEEAKALVEQSSRMVEDAGATTARKLADGAEAARATLGELSALLGEIEQRSVRLPDSARAQAEQVRAALSEGMDELRAQARRTAEEAEAIDQAFQERVKRNFEMLSEAIRLMGVAAVTPPPQPPPQPAPPALADQVRRAAAPPADLADSIGLRDRIRLTPTATDREFSAVFQAAGGQAPAEPEDSGETGETWTWKDLLASLDGEDGDGERLEDALANELAAMGVDTVKLLPKARVEEVAAAIQAGDLEGGRAVVRKLAPAATRRIARRLFTDDAVKRRAEIYLRRYKTLMDDAAMRDPQGFVLAELLADSGGRIFLLLDAAAGDMI
ncbi:MAG: polar localization protein TipN [Phenylobacterium sp.]|uniref:polar localization protein TipN n=1 Tax=Phenylobacterium sp. TaxID=1871053 RepID=UPI0025DEF2BD|nr:polar localization protein TipN [Phenylobacterium sp.]MBI1198431.1 polar localization protein TipN [Phenylobacterium sp.]